MLQLKLNWLPAPTGNYHAADGGDGDAVHRWRKKAKMRPGDVLGALTGDMGFDGADIGKITVHPAHVYVAIRQNMAQKAYKQLQNGKIKGKACRVRLLK
jgi:ATP-independent RNA helicase DbpA